MGLINGGLRNLTELNVIPDSEDLQSRYDFTEEDGSAPVTDQTGNGFDLSGTYSGVNVNINGVQAGEFDKVDDQLSASYGTTEAQPNHIFAVIEWRTTSTDSEVAFDGDTTRESIANTKNQNYGYFAGFLGESNVTASGAYVFNVLFNGTSSKMRINGVEEASGDSGSQGLDGVRLGNSATGGEFAAVNIGEVLVYPLDKTPIETDVEQYLADKWGITI